MTTSSPSPTRPDRRGLGALLSVAAAFLCLGATPAVPLPVDAVIAGDRQTSVVVDLSASTRSGTRSAAVTVDGGSRAATLVPLMSDGLAVTIVVDTATADAATVPAWLSAAARFILEAPGATRATVIGDSAPAAVIAPPQGGPTGIVAALDNVKPHGDRDTAAALDLAARQFPGVAAGRKLVVVYTGAADAGGPSATQLADRFRAAGVLLAVVTTADASPYWTAAAEATGGFFAPAGHPVVVPALDQVETTLGGRYLVQFPTPAHRPATVPLRVSTPDLTLTADVAVPPAATPPPPAHPHLVRTIVLVALAVTVLGLLAAGSLTLRGRRRRHRRPPPIVIAHGRASVPGSLPPPEP